MDAMRQAGRFRVLAFWLMMYGLHFLSKKIGKEEYAIFGALLSAIMVVPKRRGIHTKLGEAYHWVFLILFVITFIVLAIARYMLMRIERRIG